MKIVVLDSYTVSRNDLNWDMYKDIGDLEVFENTDRSEVIENAYHADAILSNAIVFDKDTLSALPNLKYIGVLATGVNGISLEECKKRNITVTNVPGYSTESVAQTVFALLLEIVSRVGHHNRGVHKGDWCDSDIFSYWDFPLIELSGLTMGIIGFGSIGSAVGRIAKGFGMNVLTYTRTSKRSKYPEIEFVSFDQLLQNSDVISLNCPLTEETKELIDRDAISKMKARSILINTGRGGLVNEKDLADALNYDRIFAAGVDVLSKEPPSPANPLLKAKNCFITPHMAWGTVKARKKLLTIAYDNLRSFIEGNLKNVII